MTASQTRNYDTPVEIQIETPQVIGRLQWRDGRRSPIGYLKKTHATSQMLANAMQFLEGPFRSYAPQIEFINSIPNGKHWHTLKKPIDTR